MEGSVSLVRTGYSGLHLLTLPSRNIESIKMPLFSNSNSGTSQWQHNSHEVVSATLVHQKGGSASEIRLHFSHYLSDAYFVPSSCV